VPDVLGTRPGRSGSAGTGPVSITIINGTSLRGVTGEAKTTRTPDGGISVEVRIKDAVRDVIHNDVRGGGPIADTFEQTYGLDRMRGG